MNLINCCRSFLSCFVNSNSIVGPGGAISVIAGIGCTLLYRAYQCDKNMCRELAGRLNVGVEDKWGAQVIEALWHCNSEDRGEIIELLKSLSLEWRDSFSLPQAIHALAKCGSKEREEIIAFVKEFCQGLCRRNISEMIEVLSMCNSKDRGEMSALLRSSPMDRLKSTSFLFGTLNVLAKRDSKDREEIIAIVKQFNKRIDMTPSEIFLVIEALAKCESTDRELLVNQIEGLTRQLIQIVGGVGIVASIIQVVSRLNGETRGKIIQRAANKIVNEFPLLANNIEVDDRVCVLLRTPLDREFPPIGLPLNRAAGINVHDDHRDLRTRNALELLRNKTGDMDDDEIKNGVEKFISYLKNFDNKDGAQARALFALNGRGENHQDFPALLGDSTFTIAGLNFPGQELIARLWKFAEGETDPREKENAKVSIVRALSNSVENDGHRVCNPGKVQRLVTGVLQGRLEGVDVDSFDFNINQAYQRFLLKNGNQALYDQIGKLSVEHYHTLEGDRKFEVKNQLDQEIKNFKNAAEQFCNENPMIPRAEFLQILHKEFEL